MSVFPLQGKPKAQFPSMTAVHFYLHILQWLDDQNDLMSKNHLHLIRPIPIISTTTYYFYFNLNCTKIKILNKWSVHCRTLLTSKLM